MKLRIHSTVGGSAGVQNHHEELPGCGGVEGIEVKDEGAAAANESLQAGPVQPAEVVPEELGAWEELAAMATRSDYNSQDTS